MPQLKGAHAHARFFRGDTRERTVRIAQTAEEDRTRLIRECLRDLKGIELIYAIRCLDNTIKIGWTRNINARRKQFDTAFDALLAVRPGTYEEEQVIHDQLSASVAHGREYYHPTLEVVAWVNDLRATLGVDPI